MQKDMGATTTCANGATDTKPLGDDAAERQDHRPRAFMARRSCHANPTRHTPFGQGENDILVKWRVVEKRHCTPILSDTAPLDQPSVQTMTPC